MEWHFPFCYHPLPNNCTVQFVLKLYNIPWKHYLPQKRPPRPPFPGLPPLRASERVSPKERTTQTARAALSFIFVKVWWETDEKLNFVVTFYWNRFSVKTFWWHHKLAHPVQVALLKWHIHDSCLLISWFNAGFILVHFAEIHRFWKCRKLSFLAWVFR